MHTDQHFALGYALRCHAIVPSGGGRAVWSDGGVRPEMGPASGGRRGAEPPALGPRSGKFWRFETLEGHFLVKIAVLFP